MPSRVDPKLSSGFLNSTQLSIIKRKALRRGIWYRFLQKIDRALFDVTLRVTSRIRSSSLARSILSVVQKIEGFLENEVLRAVREVGFPLARKIGILAQSWGLRSARLWGSDEGFARYLAVMKLNG